MLTRELLRSARTLREVTGQARGSCSCLVAVGVYSMIILLAFIVVTALYVTSSSECKTKPNHAQNIKELVHYDILAVDNSVNDRDWGDIGENC